MTSDHTVVPSLSSVSSSSNFIDNLPSERHSIHDIRLRFTVEGIWSIISSTHPELIPNKVSKDISLVPVKIYDMEIKIIVHHSDTVSVIIACSLTPVIIDPKGLIRLSSGLTLVEERLSGLVAGCPHTMSPAPQILIPNHNSWIAMMWHFGTDSQCGYASEKFEMTWEDAENALIRIYTKDLKDGKGIRIRTERQEYPNKRFDVATEEKLNALGSS